MRARGQACVVLAAALLAGGCGGGAKSNGEAQKAADRVLADAQAAATGASTVHVAGSIVDNGTPLTLDLHLVEGKGGGGTMSENGLRFEIVRVGGTAYLRGSDAFLRKFAGAAAAQLLHGKWLSGSATKGDLAALVPLTDMATFFHGITGKHGTLKNEGETTYKGQKVVAIRDTSQGGTLYVAATGTPFPVALAGGKGAGTVTFDAWNESASIEAPKGAIDISKLNG